MRAIVRDRYGSPDVMRLADIDKPELPDDAALVRVHATSINAMDWHMLRGEPYIARLDDGLRRPKSRVLGVDVAGVVEAVGPDVTDLKPGDRVYGSRSGAFAEYITGKNLVPMPQNLTFEQAAAVSVAGQTALQGLRDKGGLEPGDRVMVVGAGGGVGTFAVQIARALGARVTAASRPQNADMLRSIGAEEVVDYTRGNFTRASGQYDVILDIGGRQSLSSLRRMLTPNGRIVMVAPGRGNWIGYLTRIVWARLTSRFSSRKALSFLSHVSKDDLLVLKEMIEAGKVTPVIDRVFRFEEIPEAIRYVEDGHPRGKVVITV